MKLQNKETKEIPNLDNIKILNKKLSVYAEQSLECDRVIKDAQLHKELCMEKLKEALGNHTYGRLGPYSLNWGFTNFKAQPEKVIPAKAARTIRKKNINIKKF
tara:strand:+ start:299 stop:607 length:309 start_codon:yes stop_codon:yes gene_type:complete